MKKQTKTKEKRILIVEDSQSLREFYVEVLKQEGFTVDEAVDGKEGYEGIKKGQYDFILLDIVIPKIDGLTILQKLQKEKNWATLKNKIMVMTNLGEDEVAEKCSSFGVDKFLVKTDYTPDQIVNLVKKYCL